MRMPCAETATRARGPAPVPGDKGVRRWEDALQGGAGATSLFASWESHYRREARPPGDIVGSCLRLEPLADNQPARPASVTSCWPLVYARIAPRAVRRAAAVGGPILGRGTRRWQAGRGARSARTLSRDIGCWARASARAWANAVISHSSRWHGSVSPRLACARA
jgi:hypothetical protein